MTPQSKQDPDEARDIKVADEVISEAGADRKRYLIAEFCGYRIERHSQGRRLIHPDGHIINNHYAEPWRLPDYLNDLNAMHEAEKKMSMEQAECYFWNLLKACNLPDNLAIYQSARLGFCAPACKRAEALLITLGLQ